MLNLKTFRLTLFLKMTISLLSTNHKEWLFTQQLEIITTHLLMHFFIISKALAVWVKILGRALFTGLIKTHQGLLLLQKIMKHIFPLQSKLQITLVLGTMLHFVKASLNNWKATLFCQLQETTYHQEQQPLMFLKLHQFQR